MFVTMSKSKEDSLVSYLETFLTENRKNLFQTVLSQRTRHFTAVLEDIYQPHNSSAVLRSCEIFGIQDVHLIENNYVSKVSRHVAKGSQKWLTIHRYRDQTNNTESCLKDLKSKGYQIIATTPHNDSSLLQDFDISKKSAFIFGVEKDGVSDYVKKNTDGFLKIPMVGFTESLNISVAAAIIINNVTSKLKQSSINWKLTKTDKDILYKEWIEKTIKNVDRIKEHYLNK